MTLRVPISAASEKGSGSSDHGVDTIRGVPSSTIPSTSGTGKPTQSTSRTFSRVTPSGVIPTASSGVNFGSVVMTVRPLPACGRLSRVRSRSRSSLMFGRIISSAKRRTKVDFPTRTGPTTPI